MRATRAGDTLGTRGCLREQNMAVPWGKPQPWAAGGTLGTGTRLSGTHGWGCGQLETNTAAARTEGPGVLDWGPGLWPQGLVRAIQAYECTQSPGSGLCAPAVTGKERKWNIRTFQKRQCLIKISIFTERVLQLCNILSQEATEAKNLKRLQKVWSVML